MKFELPKLEYAYSSLEPYIDEATMKFHHDKHHQTYTDKLNAALERHPELNVKSAEELLMNLEKVPEDIRKAVRNNGGGYVNHNFFWKILKKDIKIEGKIKQAIEERFGSFENFREEFSNAAINLFGSGWAWLVVDNGKLEITTTQNQDNPISEGKIPVLTIDLWEHAYYLKYQNKRADYVNAFFNVINWQRVEDNFVNASKMKLVKKGFNELASEEDVRETMNSLKARNVNVELVKTRKDALRRLKELIPEKAEVMTGGSTTLGEIGFNELLKSKKHSWINLKDEILAEKDQVKQGELRRKSVTSNYFIGSVHAVSRTGEILIASASGSQIPSYAFSSDNVIWVVGTQKIVKTLEEGFKRLKEYVFPLEDKRMKDAGFGGSTFGKILIFEREIMPNRKIHLIFVNEVLGF